MQTLSVFLASLAILRRSISVWLFAAIVVLFAAITSLSDDLDSPLICLAAVSSLLSIVAMVPLIIAAENGRKNLPFHVTQLKGLNLALVVRLILLSITLTLLFLLFSAIWVLLRRLTGLDPESSLDWFLRAVLLVPLGQAVAAFALCGVAISGLPPLKSATNALLISLNNFPRLVLLLVPIELLTLLIYGLGRLLADGLGAACSAPVGSQVACPSPFAIAALWAYSGLGRLVLQALGAVLFVVAYSVFTGKEQYPWLQVRPAA